jgi:hypothetical protein
VFASALVLLAAAAVWSLVEPLGDARNAAVARALALSAALLAVAFHRPEEPSRTRLFWRVIGLGLAFFLATQLWQMAAGSLMPPMPARRRDLLYLGRYVFIVMALELRPDAPRPGRSEEELRLLDIFGAVLFLASLVAYVLVSPAFHEAAGGAGTTLRALYLVLDVFLVVRTFALSRFAPSPYWRHAYVWLGIAFALRGLNNVLTASERVGMSAIGADPPVGLPWLSLFVPLLIAARLHMEDAPQTSAADAAASARSRLSPLVAYAFTLPIFISRWSGSPSSRTRPPGRARWWCSPSSRRPRCCSGSTSGS